IDTFPGPSTLGWAMGPAAGLSVTIALGGPAGASDTFLVSTADGAGAGGKLTIFNRAQWTGNFLSGGVSAIEMDLRNLGGSALSIRIGLKQSASPSAPGFVSDGFVLPVDGNWHHATFLLDSAHLTRLDSTTLALDTLLSSVGEFRILNSAVASFLGDEVVSQL